MKRIGIFGHYGNNNLGDESIIKAVIQNLTKLSPSVECVGFSINPQDTARRHKVEAYPIRRHVDVSGEKKNIYTQDPEDAIEVKQNSQANETFSESLKKILKGIPFVYPVARFLVAIPQGGKNVYQEVFFLARSYQVLKGIDALMITGSNQFLDNFGGSWGFPYTLLKWTLLAKLTGSKVYYVCVGAGPLTLKLSKIFLRIALYFSDYVSLRDVSSEQLIRNIGYKGKTKVYPDLAHSLDISQVKPRAIKGVSRDRTVKPKVAINPMPLYDPRYWWDKDPQKYSAYKDKIIQFSIHLYDENYPFYFFSTMEKDNNVIEDIVKGIHRERGVEIVENEGVFKSKTVNELMENIGAADIVVATRFHGTVLSLLSGKNLLGVCYQRKAVELMEDIRQGEYAVELDSFTAEDLWNRFKVLEKNMKVEKEKICHREKDYVELLGQQYNFLLAN